MRNSLILFFLFTGFLTSNTLARKLDFFNPKPYTTFVETLSVGSTWNNSGKNQTFYLSPQIQKTYVTNSSTNALFDGELFLGFQRTLFHHLQSQLGLALSSTNNVNLSGEIWDDADPQFNNYVFHYKIIHTRTALKVKLLADKKFWIIPWVSTSLGIGFNDAYLFTNTPIIFEATPNNNFTSHLQIAFTYTVAIGIQKILNSHWQIGIGYEFADWGKSQLGRASGQTLNQGLSLNHFYTNGLLVNMTYLGEGNHD